MSIRDKLREPNQETEKHVVKQSNTWLYFYIWLVQKLKFFMRHQIPNYKDYYLLIFIDIQCVFLQVADKWCNNVILYILNTFIDNNNIAILSYQVVYTYVTRNCIFSCKHQACILILIIPASRGGDVIVQNRIRLMIIHSIQTRVSIWDTIQMIF